MLLPFQPSHDPVKGLYFPRKKDLIVSRETAMTRIVRSTILRRSPGEPRIPAENRSGSAHENIENLWTHKRQKKNYVQRFCSQTPNL